MMKSNVDGLRELISSNKAAQDLFRDALAEISHDAENAARDHATAHLLGNTEARTKFFCALGVVEACDFLLEAILTNKT